MERSALITGAAQGVGEAIARRLATDGVKRLTLTDRNRSGLEAIASELRSAGCDVLTVTGDLALVSECKRIAREAEQFAGSVDIVVNAAGVTLRGGILDTSEEDFDRIFAVNTRAPLFLTQAILPSMIEARQGGVIINISSMNAYGGPTYLLSYSASKAALNALTRNVANSVRWHRIRVHSINLGWTVTPSENQVQSVSHGRPVNWAYFEGANQPFGRLLNAEDPAALCSFLASDQATMMTGCVIDQEQWIAGTPPSRKDGLDHV